LASITRRRGFSGRGMVWDNSANCWVRGILKRFTSLTGNEVTIFWKGGEGWGKGNGPLEGMWGGKNFSRLREIILR